MATKKTVIAVVKMTPGQTAYYDPLTRIYLTIAHPTARVYGGMNTSQLKRSVKAGRLKVIEGKLDPDGPFFRFETRNGHRVLVISNDPYPAPKKSAPAKQKPKAEDKPAEEPKKEEPKAEPAPAKKEKETKKETPAEEKKDEAKSAEETADKGSANDNADNSKGASKADATVKSAPRRASSKAASKK